MSDETRRSIAEALMSLAAERPWDEVTLQAVAERAGVGLADLRTDFDGRLAILQDFTRGIDGKVLAAIDPHMAGEPARERLFDTLFNRIEALGAYKSALRNISDAARRDPLLLLELNRVATLSMGWMLTASAIHATGTMGAVQAQGLALAWSRVLKVWLGEDDPTLPQTMAELDRQLRRLEQAAVRIDRICALFRPSHRERTVEFPQPPPSNAQGDIVEAHPS